MSVAGRRALPAASRSVRLSRRFGTDRGFCGDERVRVRLCLSWALVMCKLLSGHRLRFLRRLCAKRSARPEQREGHSWPGRHSEPSHFAELVAGYHACLRSFFPRASANTVAPANVKFGKREKTADRGGSGLESSRVFVLNFLAALMGHGIRPGPCFKNQRAGGKRKKGVPVRTLIRGLHP